jgi:hypothetical protein
VCVKVEVVDASLDYNILLGRSWTYAMQVVFATIFRVLLFPHEGWIMTIDQLSFSYPNPSSGASMVPMIDNSQPDIINIGVGLCPPLMGTFDYLHPSDDVKFISDQPKVEIFQVSSFCMTYLNDPWTLPSPSTMMEGTRQQGMDMPLSTTEVAYSIVQQASVDPDLTPAQELDLILKPNWAPSSLADTDPLDLVLPSDEAIIEEMTSPNRPWDDLHQKSYFLPELRRIEAIYFNLTMTRDRYFPINPLDTHVVYTEGNMETIAEMIPIDISRTPSVA